MGLLSTTTKLKKDGIWSFGLPAIKTCPNAGICKKGCYANAGRYIFGAVKEKREKNFRLTLGEYTFFVDMCDEIAKLKPKIVRIHDSGDFYSAVYYYTWRKIAEEFPNVVFYAYTKQVDLIKRNPPPRNMHIIFSYGGLQDALIDPEKDRHARVFETEEALDAAGYTNAMESDLLALGEEKKIGLVYHGTKKFSNTDWSKS